jgi:rifampin ADP-ribosylating transferase
MENEPTSFPAQDPGPLFHGTKADLKAGNLLEPGYSSNFGERRTANYVYLTATKFPATRQGPTEPGSHCE